jgi:hypothetical protein
MLLASYQANPVESFNEYKQTQLLDFCTQTQIVGFWKTTQLLDFAHDPNCWILAGNPIVGFL